MANTLQQLDSFGQSIWLDNINRVMIESGKLKELISQGLLGMTSNPTIFDKAISSSSEYDEKMIKLAKEGKSTFEIYDELTVKDVQDAIDIFKSVYEKTKGLDGYVSLEINPKLAYNIKETIAEGKRLWKKVNRANLMLKVPSTNEGFGAVEELTALGMNINITLIFSLEQYINTFKAYINGIKRFIEGGGDESKVHSVASVFVSRIDTVVDAMLDKMMPKANSQQEKVKLENLKGKAAVANSAIIY
ncbi:MAG: transaldolase, partial [Candidatus Omnitrophota bacterium]